jgi:hypothetical protein
MDLRCWPALDLRALVQQGFHEPENAGIVDLDPRNFALAHDDRECQALKQWKIHMDIPCLSFEVDEPIRHPGQDLPQEF